jgi:predicted 2-oxoglutarate/Fe(II)-dependent dioxygenase YbiX
MRADDTLFFANALCVAVPIVDARRDVPVTRHDVAPGCYVVRGLLAPAECRRLVAVAAAHGFTHAGLAVGDDVYRVDRAVRTNGRVVLDAPALAAVLDARLRSTVDQRHERRVYVGVNPRLRVYEYRAGQYFRPHVDVRTRVAAGETRFSVVAYLSAEFEGGATRFFEAKDRARRRGRGRARKRDNRVRFALRPLVGDAVVFDHGLLHEGAAVTAGVKYAVRTDLVYADAPPPRTARRAGARTACARCGRAHSGAPCST